MNREWLLPVRRLHGKLVQKRIQLNKNYLFWKYICFPLGRKALIAGVPEYTNLGDSAIALSQIRFLQNLGFDIYHVKQIMPKEYREYRKQIKEWLPKKSFISSIGGGNMGNQWFVEEELRWNVLKDFAKIGVTVFPQTIYYTPTEDGRQKQQESIAIYNHPNMRIVAREQKSYEIMCSLYPNAKILLTPDIVLSSTMEDYGVVPQKRTNILWVMRCDAERSMTDEVRSLLLNEVEKTGFPVVKTDMYSDCPVNKQNRLECVRKKMQEFCGAKLVITDRLHGMVFAAITGTPCIVFSNYNQKVKGTYDWISYLPYIRYVETVEDAISAIPELLSMKECHFDNTPLLPYFEKLKEFIMEK